MKRYLILLILVSYTSFSQETINLTKAIEYGIENSHGIAIIKNDAAIIKNSTHLGAAGMLSNISISSGYNGSINDAELEFNSFLEFGDMDSDVEATQAKSANLSSSIGLTYRLFNGFSGIYTLNKFKSQKVLADENVRYQIESKIIEIVNQYYDLLNKQNIYDILKTSHNISSDRHQQALEKHEFGSVSKRELLNVEVVLNEDKIRMDEAFINVKSSKLNLALLLGIKESSFSIGDEFVFNNQLEINDLLNKARENNSSVVIAELNYLIAQDELKISKSNFSPTVDFFSSYSYNNRQSETSFISKQKDRGIIAGFNIEIPIFSGNIRRNNFQNAKINLDSKSHYLEEIKNTIETALLNAYYSYSDGLNSLILIEENLVTAERNYQISKELYQMGQLGNIEYREAQLQLDQIRINYSVKLSTTKIQEYIIYQLSGQLKTK